MAEAAVGAAVARATALLGESDTPRLDAELLLSDVLGVGREQLVIDRDVPLPDDVARRFRALVDRRVAREPVAYILGRRGFRNLDLAVDRRVLIPRPETEGLVEVGLELPRGASVLDVGTGSGAIALALKDERPDLVVSGVDASADAVAVARANAARLGLDVRFAAGDLLAGCGPCDAVLANLPYVEDGALASLEPEITRYEPREALFAGVDGLDLIRRLIGSLVRLPWRPSMIALEIGPPQALEVRALLTGAGWGSVSVRADLAGRDRVVVGVV
ncbi:MAG: peptide chain release factor N(5)-glutamine methyltransferase [Solirubrobacteraceae bacterium]